MVKPVQLHPRIRERTAARVSASALAEFIIASPDKQDEVLHDARFMRPPAVSPYADFLRLTKSYCADPHRNLSTLTDGAAALIAKSQSLAFTPSQREEAARCAEAVALFREAANQFGADGMALLEAPRFEHLDIKGVGVSVQPDLIVGIEFPPTTQKIGLVFLRAQKRPDPGTCKTDKTRLERREYRFEMARYILVLGWMRLIKLGIPENLIDTKKMAVWDVRMKESIPFPSDRLSREKKILAACGQISRLWATVTPKPSDFAKEA